MKGATVGDKREEGGVCADAAIDAVTGASVCAGVDAKTGATMRYEHGVDADGLRVSKRSDAGESAGEKLAQDCLSVEDMERFVDAVTTASWKAPSEEAEEAFRANLDAMRASLPPIVPPGTAL